MNHVSLSHRWMLRMCVGLAVLLIGQNAPAQNASAPAAQPAREQELIQQIDKSSDQLGTMLGESSSMFDPKKRAELAPKVIPALHEYMDAVLELAKLDAKYSNGTDKFRIRTLAMLSVFGDDQAAKEIKQMESGNNADEAMIAHCTELLADWWTHSGDAAAQGKTLDAFKELAKKTQDDPQDQLTFVALNMQLGATNPKLGNQVKQVVIDDLHGPMARKAAPELRAQLKLGEIVDKPLAFSGPTIDGKTFKSADWKGKVVLVDFWATWCPPCRAEIPNVIAAYQKFHDKGLEIVGVSLDQKGDDLKTFLQENKEIVWPQIFDPSKTYWEAPLATEYGIQSIPTMFLIDKKGVLRSVTARENYMEEIPKLLDEKAD